MSGDIRIVSPVPKSALLSLLRRRVTLKNIAAKNWTAHNWIRAAMVQWNHACFGVRGVSKCTGSNPVHGLSVDLTAIDKSGKTTSHEYYLLKKYEVLKGGGDFKLIRRWNANEDPIYFATMEDTFDIIKRAHTGTGHRGRNKKRSLTNSSHAARKVTSRSCILARRIPATRSERVEHLAE
ncbi:hypothetical protein E2C01_016274 [Portunus trituberculatus]|uniref:Uncharacterized protein n=1 Tax=Portunus trituberculatus TaxID=210409 RepID=A0A5B7DPU5_PORTR|nr:hypothetical protein [Portunus trituberculatus]